MTGDFVYLDPHAQPGAEQDPYDLRFEARPGATVALFANMYPDSVPFSKDLEAPLAALLPGVAFRLYEKGSPASASSPARPELLEEIGRDCDAVVLVYGHCGSCAANLVHDTVALARAGRPVVPLATEAFVDSVRFIARAGGLADLPFVFLPHPVAGESVAFHKALAAAIAPAIVAALATGQGADCARIMDGRAAA